MALRAPPLYREPQQDPEEPAPRVAPEMPLTVAVGVRIRSSALSRAASEPGPPRPPSASVPRGRAAPSARRRSQHRHLVSPSLRGLERPERQLRGCPPTPRPKEQFPVAPRLAPDARTHHTKSPSRRLTAAILPPNHHRRTGRRELQVAPAPPIGLSPAT